MEFLGNQKAKQTLEKMKQSGRISHAILLCGEKGVGKKTFARIIAQTVLCESENAPCGVCENCKKINNKTHVDVEEISEFTRPNSFPIDKVREIKKTAYVSPNEAKLRVFILANADCMKAEAQNALLKIIEEPPSTSVFILTAQNREKMLETVLSRCVSIPLLPVEETVAKEYVKSLYPEKDTKTLENMSQVFSGNIGALIDAVNDKDCIQQIDYAFDIIKSLKEKDEYKTLVLLSKLQKAQATPIFEKVVFILSRSVEENSVSHLEGVSAESRLHWLTQFICALNDITKNANIPLLMTQLCVKLYSL